MNTDKIIQFFLYAKKKNYDCSINLFDGKIIAIMNPININKIHEGEVDIDKTDEKPELIIKRINEAISKCGKEIKK